MVTTGSSTNTVIAGSSLNIICNTELCSAVDSPVNVTTEWSGPNVTFQPANPVPAVMMVNPTTYTSTVTVNAAKNGSYTCQVGMISGSVNITVGNNKIMPLLP